MIRKIFIYFQYFLCVKMDEISFMLCKTFNWKIKLFSDKNLNEFLFLMQKDFNREIKYISPYKYKFSIEKLS